MMCNLAKKTAGLFCLASIGLGTLAGSRTDAQAQYQTGDQTGDLTVSHNTGDEGVYYTPPAGQLAYNVQILRLPPGGPASYATVYHGEPRKPAGDGNGDAVKVGLLPAGSPFTYQMPSSTNFAIWNISDDPGNMLYSALENDQTGYTGLSWSGAGNPMTVKGLPGDPYYYTFFISEYDDSGQRATDTGSDYRSYIGEARTTDFVNWQIRSQLNGQAAWNPWNGTESYIYRRASPVTDTSGSALRSISATSIQAASPCIGSICYVQGLYYYFYTDWVNDGTTNNDASPPYKGTYHVYYRTCPDVSSLANNWSPATQVGNAAMAPGVPLRVAKAYKMDRWAVLYSCSHAYPWPGDEALQYTANLNVNGPGGLSSIQFFDNIAPDGNISDLGFGHSHCQLGLLGGTIKGQEDWLTDQYGNLTVPDDQQSNPAVGGMITWCDLLPNGNGQVWRAGFGVSGQPLANGTYQLVPASTNGGANGVARLDAVNFGNGNDTRVQIYGQNGATAQKWTFTYMPNAGSGYYKIQPSYNTGISLNVYGSKPFSGNVVDLWQDYGDTDAYQRWLVTQNADGTWRISPQCNTGFALDDNQGNTTDHAVVDLWQFSDGDPHEEWWLKPS